MTIIIISIASVKLPASKLFFLSLKDKKMDKYLNSLLNFLGYGNLVTAKLYVFGIEERLTDPKEPVAKQSVYINKYNSIGNSYALTNEDIYKCCPELERNLQKEATENKFYTRVTQLCNKLLIDEERVTNQELGSTKSKVFISNYSFIARIGTKEPRKNCEEVFYKNHLIERDKILKKFFPEILKKKDNIILTFGIIGTFRKLLEEVGIELDKIPFSDSISGRGKYYLKAKNKNIFLFYHPSYNWLSEEQINRIDF